MAIIVTYRRTRRLSMRIAQNGDVRVSAPIGLAKREVEAFIEKNYEWVEAARKKVANRQQQRHPALADYHCPIVATICLRDVRAASSRHLSQNHFPMGFLQPPHTPHLPFSLPPSAARLVH